MIVSEKAYYNEFDPNAAAWLRGLIEAGEITRGEVDERSIKDVSPGDIPGRAHFFAGIGGWDLALQIAGWPADLPVWTGSCPCQPFSAAGKKEGEKDERHLWPDFRSLIAEFYPPIVFGEQVASKDGRLWLAGVRSDLEALGYSVGAADLCAAGLGSPHIRQRLFWVADADRTGPGSSPRPGQGGGSGETGDDLGRGGSIGWLGSPSQPGSQIPEPGELRGKRGGPEGRAALEPSRPRRAAAYRLGNPEGGGCRVGRDAAFPGGGGHAIGPGWAGFSVADCRDNRSRRFEPSAFPLAYGIPRGLGRVEPELSSLGRFAGKNRIGRLKGYGNAIVPALAAEFIMAYMDVRGIR